MVEIHITQRPLHVLDSHAKKTIFHLINAKIKIIIKNKQECITTTDKDC